MQKYIELHIPDLYTTHESNSMEHWAVKWKRHKRQKEKIYKEFERLAPLFFLPSHIKLTRIAKGTLDKYDNLPYSLKWVKDAIAEQIFPGLPPGRADDDERLTWEYDQKVDRCYSVKIEIFKA